ncbi:hypothetical protein BX666DRAFT_111504 [Dichotomocladium elegans]|nr:hypothetical protein BX666DRAFT_111504 [Dichotomocladium elegans]
MPYHRFRYRRSLSTIFFSRLRRHLILKILHVLAMTSPLISPAIAPTNDRIYQMNAGGGNGGEISNNNNKDSMVELTFSPLSSPALHAMPYQAPVLTDSASRNSSLTQISTELLPESMLHHKLALIEKEQELLRSAHQELQSHSTHPHSTNSGSTATATSAAAMAVIKTMDSTTTITQQPSRASEVAPHLQSHRAQTTTTGGGAEPASSFPSSSSRTSSPFVITQPPGASASRSDANFFAPATPSLLMKLGQVGTNGSSNSSSSSSSTVSPATASNFYSSAVDKMTSLPAAMLQDKQQPISQSGTPKKALLSNARKRRRTTRATAEAFTSPGLYPTAAHLSPQISATNPSLAALLSPAALRPHMPSSTNLTASRGSVSTAAVAGSVSSPRALKPLISPSLKPNGRRLSPLEEQAAAAALATKSNYQNIREGNATNLGIDFSSSFPSGVENRRSAHKAAEQKRRDTLKQNLEALRKEITSTHVKGDDSQSSGSDRNAENDDTPEEEAKEKSASQMSKQTKTRPNCTSSAICSTGI